MKLLLDTNVLVDYYARRMLFWEDTLKLRIAEHFGDVELWVSAQSFSDIEYILRKAIPIGELREMFAESAQFLKICGVSTADVHEAFQSGWPDLEDCLIACAAKRVKADYLITRDKKGFSRSTVPVMSPREFISWFQRSHGIEYEELRLA